MSRVTLDDGALHLDEVDDGAVAVIDADWLEHPPQGLVPAIVVDGQGTVAWTAAGESFTTRPADPLLVAAGLLLRIVDDVSRAVPEGASVEVVGSGIVAAELRRRFQDNRTPTDVVIECTGDGATIGLALERLPVLGTLVLCGERCPSIPLDLYPDVHLRGITVVGVERTPKTAAEHEIPAWWFDALVRCQSGKPPPVDAPWYAVTA